MLMALAWMQLGSHGCVIALMQEGARGDPTADGTTGLSKQQLKNKRKREKLKLQKQKLSASNQ